MILLKQKLLLWAILFPLVFFSSSGSLKAQENESSSNIFDSLSESRAIGIEKITVPTAKIYKEFEKLIFKIYYADRVLITGKPYLILSFGGVKKRIYYKSGHLSNIITFYYQIPRTEKPVDEFSLNPTIYLNGGTITAVKGNPVISFSPPSISGVEIKPTLLKVTIKSPSEINKANYKTYSLSGECLSVSATMEVSIGAQKFAGVKCVSYSWNLKTADLSKLPDAKGIQISVTQLNTSASNRNATASVTKDILPPKLTGLKNDILPKKILSWKWACEEPCNFRFLIDEKDITKPTGIFSILNNKKLDKGDGKKYIHVEAQDTSGNTTLLHIYGIIDNTVPIVSINILPEIIESNKADFAISGNCSEENHDVTIKIGSDSKLARCTEKKFKESFDMTLQPQQDKILVTATQIDKAGNNSILAQKYAINTIKNVLVAETNFVEAPIVQVQESQQITQNLIEGMVQTTTTEQAIQITNPVEIVNNFTQNTATVQTTTVAEDEIKEEGKSFVYTDTTAPRVLSAVLSSTNPIATLAKPGDTISLAFRVSEPLKEDPIVKIDGENATIEKVSSTEYSATLELQDTNNEGAVSIYIDGIFDLWSNEGDLVKATTSGPSIRYDKTLPVLSKVSLKSDNPNPIFSKIDDQIFLSFKTSEELQWPPKISVTGDAVEKAQIKLEVDGFVITYKANDEDEDGDVKFAVEYRDLAGNIGIKVVSTQDESKVTFDKTPPTVDDIHLESNNPNKALSKVEDDVTLTYISSETLLTPKLVLNGVNVPLNNEENNFTGIHKMNGKDTEGFMPLVLTYFDLAGNPGKKRVDTTDESKVRFDRTTPIISDVHIESDNIDKTRAKQGNKITLTFSSSEALLPTIVKIGGNDAEIEKSGNDYVATHVLNENDIEGTIAFSIDYKDLASNQGVQIVETQDETNVLYDQTPPTLSEITIKSNNPDSTRSKVGDLITLNFTVSETLLTREIKISGQDAKISNVENNYTATYEMTEGDVQGTIAFSINYIDLAGNPGVQRSDTMDDTAVLFDRTMPTLSLINFKSSNPDNRRSKIGDLVTLIFTSSETLLNTDITINGQTPTTNSAGNQYSITYTMTQDDREGIMPFNIDYNDLAGNPGAQTKATNDASQVEFDKTAPTLSGIHLESANQDNTRAKVGDLITLKFSLSEPLLNNRVTIGGNTANLIRSGLDYTATHTLTSDDNEGFIGFTIDHTDLAGNPGLKGIKTQDSSAVNFDQTPPTLLATSIKSNNPDSTLSKVGDMISLSFTSSEPLLTKSATVDGKPAEINSKGNNHVATYTLTGEDNEGALAFTIDYVDLAGNVGAQIATTSDETSVRFDRTAPILSLMSLKSNNRDLTRSKIGDQITLTYNSSETLLVNGVVLDDSGAEVATDGFSHTATYTMIGENNEGNISFKITYTDLAGNPNEIITQTADSTAVLFDRTAPKLSGISVKSNNSDATRAKVGDLISLSFNSTETLLSTDIKILGNQASVSNDGNNHVATYTLKQSDGEGDVSFSINYLDLSSNPGKQRAATTDNTNVKFDSTPPVLSNISIRSNNLDKTRAKVGNRLTLTFTASEALLTKSVKFRVTRQRWQELVMIILRPISCKVPMPKEQFLLVSTTKIWP